MPESALHDLCVDLVRDVLVARVRRTGRDAAVFRNMAVRPLQSAPRAGFDPDVALVEPCPPDPESLDSLKLWVPGSLAPALAVEIVSKSHPYKDHEQVPEQCAAIGVRELVVFDPLLAGPRRHGGPHRVQVWRRIGDEAFERVYAGPGPAQSEVLGAFCVVTDGGRRLRFADDAAGQRLWPTPEEEKQARIAELEVELARRR